MGVWLGVSGVTEGTLTLALSQRERGSAQGEGIGARYPPLSLRDISPLEGGRGELGFRGLGDGELLTCAGALCFVQRFAEGAGQDDQVVSQIFE